MSTPDSLSSWLSRSLKRRPASTTAVRARLPSACGTPAAVQLFAGVAIQR